MRAVRRTGLRQRRRLAYIWAVGGFFCMVQCRFRAQKNLRKEGFESGAPGRSRTCGLWRRRPTLYPTELRARSCISKPVPGVCQGETAWRAPEEASFKVSACPACAGGQLLRTTDLLKEAKRPCPQGQAQDAPKAGHFRRLTAKWAYQN